MGTPAAEVEIDEALIRRLLSGQAPEYAELPVDIVARGWDTVTARLGDELAVRVPLRAMSAQYIVNEQEWLATVAQLVTVDVPVPRFVGKPHGDYPWTWSIVPWFEGTTAEHEPLMPDQAGEFGDFLCQLHVPPPSNAPANPFRGSPLADHSEGVIRRWEAFMAEGAPVADVADRALEIWHDGLEAPVHSKVVWGHGDLHVRNVITRHGRLGAVIDWIDVNAGDAATDLSSVWIMFEPEQHDAVWEAYGPIDQATRTRARAWAMALGGMYLGTGLADDPGFLALGQTVIDRVLATD